MSGESKAGFANFFKPPLSRTSEFSSSQDALSNVDKKDLLKDGYRKSNQSLVLKVHRLEAELRRSHKIIEELRTENALLRKKICDTELLDSNERIEALVEERIKV
ncbi:hypothetical protein Y032_0007g3278 [Ancylostoma ceylanicum]|uniref:cGMP-dependent protein kinase interacting domain-containing protein n=1 Tax=Ancylostoma ceylanicum TaxID=53326 RepID=A0A016VMD5_9BILA|nr:hypothetical protein Y032_0007g3278 [Ancylostoma ceylanicum]